MPKTKPLCYNKIDEQKYKGVKIWDLEHLALCTHTPSLYGIIKNETKNKEIDRGDYANMSFDISSRYNLLFLCAKICFIYKNMEKKGVRIWKKTKLFKK